MKEFEKWNKEKGCKVECYTDCLQCKGAEAAWKAALKLVNSKLWLASGQVADEVKAWIKKELEQ